MDEFKKMTRETKKLYLILLVAVLLIFLTNAINLCRYDYGNSELQFLEAGIFHEEYSDSFSEGKMMTGIISDSLANYGFVHFILVFLMFIGILMLKRYIFMEKRTAEFQMTLPVKQITRVWHDYLFPVGIMVAGVLMQGVVFLIYQTVYNVRLKELTAGFVLVDGVQENIVTFANIKLLSYIGYYILYMVVVFTMFYFGMLLTKNPMVGLMLTYIFPNTLKFIWCDLFEINYYTEIFLSEREFAENGGLARVLDVRDYLERFCRPFQDLSGCNYLDEQYMKADEVSFVILLLVLLAGIAFVGAKRELSRGSVFYFPILDYVFAVLFGVGVVFGIENFSLWYVNDVLLVIIGIAAAIIMLLVIRPVLVKRTNRLEVK